MLNTESRHVMSIIEAIVQFILVTQSAVTHTMLVH